MRTDAFNSFPGTWTISNSATTSNSGNHAKLTEPGNFGFAGASYNSSAPDNCVVEIDTQVFPASGSVYVRAYRNSIESFTVSFDNTTKLLSIPTAVPTNLGASPQALGFALTNGRVYFIYRLANMWVLAGSMLRPSWLDDGMPAPLGFGLFSTFGGNAATFDNYNLTNVLPSDLGL